MEGDDTPTAPRRKPGRPVKYFTEEERRAANRLRLSKHWNKMLEQQQAIEERDALIAQPGAASALLHHSLAKRKYAQLPEPQKHHETERELVQVPPPIPDLEIMQGDIALLDRHAEKMGDRVDAIEDRLERLIVAYNNHVIKHKKQARDLAIAQQDTQQAYYAQPQQVYYAHQPTQHQYYPTPQPQTYYSQQAPTQRYHR